MNCIIERAKPVNATNVHLQSSPCVLFVLFCRKNICRNQHVVSGKGGHNCGKNGWLAEGILKHLYNDTSCPNLVVKSFVLIIFVQNECELIVFSSTHVLVKLWSLVLEFHLNTSYTYEHIQMYVHRLNALYMYVFSREPHDLRETVK